jgi:adenosine deaminase
VIARVEDHPLPRWIDRGVRACVCADNTLLSATSAREELRRAAAIPGMDEAKLRAVVAHGHRAAFRRDR